MQTTYYTTSNFIRHTGNVVDLTEYRRKQALAQEGSLAPQPKLEEDYDYDFAFGELEPQRSWQPRIVENTPRIRRANRRERRAWALDMCASLGVVVMTAALTLQILL